MKSASAYLTNNVNCDLALVNGSQLTLHSLTHEDVSAKRKIAAHIKASNLPYGSEIVIDQPLSVNVRVEERLDDKEPSSKRNTQLEELRKYSRECNIDPRSRDIILPLTTSMNSTDYDKFFFSTGNILSPVATVQVHEPFPFDLAFAMTVHKAQGRTIRRVVIDLTAHPVHICRHVYSAVFVAMSRVEEGEHLRLLEPLTSRPRELLYEWLEDLAPEPNIKPFLKGFANEGAPWSPSLAIS